MADKSESGEEAQGHEADDSQPRRGRGFAGMDAERQRQISAEGGRAAHRKGTAHEFDSQEAREAGRKGGQASGGSRRRRGTGSGESDPESKNDGGDNASNGGGDESSIEARA